MDEDDSDVDVDIDDDDDREEPLEANESSELSEGLRLLCGKYLCFAKEWNGEADSDTGGRWIGSIVPIESSERGEVSSIR